MTAGAPAEAAPRPRREGFVRLRAGADEAARWQAAAEIAGQPSLSAWLRALADEAAATRGDGRAVAAAVVALRADIARIGNNVNQLAKAAHQAGSAPGDLADLARDVAAMRAAAERALRTVRPPRPRPAA